MHHYAFVEKAQINTLKTEDCLFCGAPLQYLERSQEMTCLYCGKKEQGNIKCPDGHYICEACHNSDSMRLIEEIVFTTTSNNPFEISELLINHPALPVLGCQHAYIAGGALMAAIKNQGSGVSPEDIKEVFARTGRQAQGGYCGLTGICGVVPAIVACFSVLTGSRCGTDRQQQITMEAATRVMRAITALTGPSCCKAYVRAGLEVAVRYLGESLGIVLPLERVSKCRHSLRHPHGCRTERCPYFDA